MQPFPSQRRGGRYTSAESADGASVVIIIVAVLAVIGAASCAGERAYRSGVVEERAYGERCRRRGGVPMYSADAASMVCRTTRDFIDVP